MAPEFRPYARAGGVRVGHFAVSDELTSQKFSQNREVVPHRRPKVLGAFEAMDEVIGYACLSNGIRTSDCNSRRSRPLVSSASSRRDGILADGGRETKLLCQATPP